MSEFAQFLKSLLDEGRVVMRHRPVPAAETEPAARLVLTKAYEKHRLDVAGPPIVFDAGTAFAAGELVRQACCF